MARTKFGNRKVHYDGMVFDSKKECQRYIELTLLQRAGHIRNLRRQVEYGLIPPQRGEDGKVIEKECKYVADFVYYDNDTGCEVVEDSKGLRTRDYIIKRKLMLYLHGIRILET